MTADQLRKSILQRAIQGKLVPQDPNDEPASVLLKKIRAEKERLIKEGKIKKSKNESTIFRGDDNCHYEKFADGTVKCIEEEILFEIPKSWEWVRLENIIELISGQDFAPEFYNEKRNGIPYITGASNMHDYNIIINRWTETPKSIAAKKDILIICKGSGVGKMAFMDIEKAHIARQIMSVRSFSYLIHREYLFNFLLYSVSSIRAKMNGLIPGIDRQTILSLLVPLPSPEEQYRIVIQAKKLIQLSKEYDKYNLEADTIEANFLELLKKSILQHAIQGKLVPQDPNDEAASKLLERIREEKKRLIKEKKIKPDKHESIIFKGVDNKYYERIGSEVLDISEDIPFEIPENWEWIRLDNLCNIYTGNSINETEKQKKYSNTSSGYPYIATKDIGQNNSIDYENGIRIPFDKDNFRIAPKNAILLCIEGGSAGKKIGITDKNVCFGNKLCCFSSFADIDNKFIYFYLQSYGFVSIFESNKTGIIGGVSINSLKTILVPLPSQREQERIIFLLEKLFRESRF